MRRAVVVNVSHEDFRWSTGSGDHHFVSGEFPGDMRRAVVISSHD